jgi:uracil-DNA glycosylase
MIVGQAPGINAARTQVPWSGSSGVILRGWLKRIGIDPGTWLDVCYLTSTTKCFPGKPPSGSGDRAPSRREQALCRSFLDREIVLVQPAIIVTLGRIAAESLLPELRVKSMTDFIGQVFHPDLGFGQVPVVPLPHPSGVSRWLNDPENRTLVDHGLERVRNLRAGAATG